MVSQVLLVMDRDLRRSGAALSCLVLSACGFCQLHNEHGAFSDTFSLDTCFVKAPGPNLLSLIISRCGTESFRSSLFFRAKAPLPSAPPAPCHRLCPSPQENSAPHLTCSITSSYLALHVAEFMWKSRGRGESSMTQASVISAPSTLTASH